MAKDNIISAVIGIVIGFIMIATLLPVGIEQLMTATLSTDTPTAVVTIIQTIIPILASVGLLFYFVRPLMHTEE